MTGRLLTPEDIRRVPIKLGQHLRGVSREYVTEIAKAQDAQTLKAVAEWLTETCPEDFHYNRIMGTKFHTSREECADCSEAFHDALANGKMPGEEK